MRKLFLLRRKDYNLYTDTWAEATIVGTYTDATPCPSCKVGRCKRVPPLIIEWDPGTDAIADFTWPRGLEDLVVGERVRRSLVSHAATGVIFDPVEMFQHPRLKKPARPTSRSKKRVWLPYRGEPLWSPRVTASCNLDLRKSGWTLVRKCEICGRQEFRIKRNARLVVDRASSPSTDFFHISEMGGLVYVSHSVKRLLEKGNFTNVIVEHRGRIQ